MDFCSLSCVSVSQLVFGQEQRSKSLQCAKPRTFIFENNDHNLKIDISGVCPNPGWDPVETEEVNLSF